MARAARQKGNREISDDPAAMETQEFEAGETALPDPSLMPEEELVGYMESALKVLDTTGQGGHPFDQ